MIFGIGTDIVQLERIEQVHEKFGERFVERLLLPAELAAFQGHEAAAALPRDALRGEGSDRQGDGHGLRARHVDPRQRRGVERLGQAGDHLVAARPPHVRRSSASAKGT